MHVSRGARGPARCAHSGGCPGLSSLTAALPALLGQAVVDALAAQRREQQQRLASLAAGKAALLQLGSGAAPAPPG